MPRPEIIAGLSAVAERYDVVLCDVWGVIHNGRESFPEACAALAEFQRARGPVVLISNAPRPSADVVPQLHALLVPDGAWSAFVSSGDVTRGELAARAPGPAWAIGPERDGVLYDGLGLRFAGPGEAAFVSCTGLYDDETETPHDYRDRLAVAAGRGLPMICANPDKVVQRGDRLIPCAGALAEVYAELGGRVVTAGKPHAPIYELCLGEAERLLGRAPDRSRVLTIGDGLPTDVLGANDQGLDLLYVAGGIDGARLLDEAGALDPKALDRLLAQAGAHARYALPALEW